VYKSATARRQAACSLSVAVAAVSLALTHHAEAADAAAVTADSNALEEVVITAEKRTESALTTPIALAVYDSENLKENQIISVADLQNIDPVLNISKGGFGDTITIRGVTSVDGTSKGTPGIAFNIDGIPINRGYEQQEAFFDLDSVEVLKGPQGTLYGASSTGGALNIITAKPKEVFEASSDVTVGDYNTRRTTDMINVPVTDTIALRAAVNYNYHDGYDILADGQPYTNGENDLTTRVSGLIKFTPDMNLLLQETAGNIGGPGAGGVNYDTLLGSPTGSAQRVVYDSPFQQLLDDTFSNFNAQFNWALGPVHLTYVGGYLNYSANEYSASTNNPIANGAGDGSGPATYNWRDYRGHFLTDSHELRLANEKPGALDWVVGANWFRENIHESDHNWSAAAPSADSLPTIADSLNGIDPLNNTIHTAKGVFGQATWHATSEWDFTGGLRYTQDSLNRYGTFAPGPGPWPNQSGGVCVAPENCVGGPNNGAETDSKLTYRANVAYHFTPTQMLYVTVASGFKGGGFNDFCAPVPPATVGGPCPYGPESLTSYEVGYKGRPLENFEFDSDLFYYDYAERQFSQLVNVDGSFIIDSVLAPAVIEGWENTFVFRPTHADELSINIALLKSHYESLETYSPFGPPAGIPGSIPVSMAGITLNDTPSFAGTLAYAHTFALTDGGSLKVHATIKYSSSYLQDNIGPYIPYTQPAFSRSNADIRYTNPTGKVYVGAFVTNIENKLQITGPPASPNYSGVPGAAPVGTTDPRTWGFTAGVKF
jgi:iron complex outermembrane receptor protein